MVYSEEEKVSTCYIQNKNHITHSENTLILVEKSA